MMELGKPVVNGGPRRWRTLSWLVGIFLLAGPGLVMAGDACLKLVFDAYCLGGDINRLAKSRSDMLYRQVQGERLALVYPEQEDTVYVLGFRGRIYKVVRKFGAANRLRFEDLLRLLTGKYGPSQDRSQFPAYARNEASRIGAIRRGDGQALHVWRPQGQQWLLRLRWGQELGVSLEYVAEGLAGQEDDPGLSGY